MMAVKLSAYCPRCGRETQSLFELLPDASKTLRSIACSSCHGKTPTAAEVDLMASVKADGKVTTEVLQSNCTGCDAPIYLDWKFCVYCRREVARPS